MRYMRSVKVFVPLLLAALPRVAPAAPSGHTAAGPASSSGVADANGTWSAFIPPPAPRRFHVAIYDPGQGRLVIFGGVDQTTRNDAWALPLGGSPSWSEIAASGTPPGQSYGPPQGVYDPVGNRLVVTTANGNDYIWSLSLGGSPTWSHVPAAGTSPSAPTGFTTVYDSRRHRMLLFGGEPYGSSTPTSDTWELTLGATPAWSLLTVSGTPPSGRYYHVAIYDSLRDRMVVFGGDDGSGGPLLNDVWTLSFGGATPTWAPLLPGGSPPSGRRYSSAIYDPVRDRMVIFGGFDVVALNDTWALSLSGTVEWVELSTMQPPAGLWGHAVTYDPGRDQMVVNGGTDTAGFLHNGTLFLLWGTPLGVRDAWTGAGPAASLSSMPNPFVSGTTVQLALHDRTALRISVLDLGGRVVRTLADGEFAAGIQRVRWDGRRGDGSPAASGVYFVRVEANGRSLMSKLVLTR